MLTFIKRNHLWLIVALGIILYLRRYLANLILYVDESMVSLDIIRLSIPNFLHQPLPYFQVAPYGFLVIEKLFVCLFGTGEYVLRIFPFVCGTVSIWLFYRMAKIYLNGGFVILALFIFIINPSLGYYSSQVKPYSTDVFFVLLSYVVIAQSCLEELNWKKTIIIAWLGAIIIWFSFPVIFILLGIALTYLLDAWVQRNLPKLLKGGFILLYWLGSLILCYKIFLYNLSQNNAMLAFQSWQDGYISLNNWLNIFSHILMDPVGVIPFSWLAGILFIIGGNAFLKTDKNKFLLLSIPLLFVFSASAFHIYPCIDRLALFLEPILLIMIVKGVETFSLKVGRHKTVTIFLLIAILFFVSFFSTLKGFIEPRTLKHGDIYEEIKPVLSYVKEHRLPKDILFICFSSIPAFEYYGSEFGFFDGSFVKKQDWVDLRTP